MSKKRSITHDFRKFTRRMLEPYAYKRDSALLKPANVTFSPTNRCNLKCPTCSYWKQDAHEGDEMTLDQIRRLLDLMREWLGPHLMSIGGGEPFYDRIFLKLSRLPMNVIYEQAPSQTRLLFLTRELNPFFVHQ